MKELTALLATDSGMHLIWDRAYFAQVHDYDSWSRELEDDASIRRNIVAAHIVPIYIHSDGAFVFTVRVESVLMPRLSEDEERRVVVQSEAYRFASRGHLDISGIEYVDADARHQVASLTLQSTPYGVLVHLMDYDDLPNALTSIPTSSLPSGLLTPPCPANRSSHSIGPPDELRRARGPRCRSGSS